MAGSAQQNQGSSKCGHAAVRLGGVFAIIPGPEAGEVPDRVEDLRPGSPLALPNKLDRGRDEETTSVGQSGEVAGILGILMR